MGAKNNLLSMDTSAIADLMKRLKDAGGNVKEAVEEALTDTASEIAAETEIALRKDNLPAKGAYRKDPSRTLQSIITDPKATWEGDFAKVAAGFNVSNGSAGLVLITGYYYNDKYTGTPKHMNPARKMVEIYRRRKFAQDMNTNMKDIISDHIQKALEGKG